MPDPRSQALRLIGVVDRALEVTVMPWEHEPELGELLAQLDSMDLPPPGHPWASLMTDIRGQCRSLVAHAQVEVGGAEDPAAHVRTESLRAKVRQETDRLLALVDLESI